MERARRLPRWLPSSRFSRRSSLADPSRGGRPPGAALLVCVPPQNANYTGCVSLVECPNFRVVPCYYDSPEQIRCITTQWLGEPRKPGELNVLKPSFLVEVDISIDGGNTTVLFLSRTLMPARWSVRNSLLFIYSDIFVSPAGSDDFGFGTPFLPFRTISRAIEAALFATRAYFLRHGVQRSTELVRSSPFRTHRRRTLRCQLMLASGARDATHNPAVYPRVGWALPGGPQL